jgi:hypothetical protein
MNRTTIHQHRVKKSIDRCWTFCVTPARCAAHPLRQNAHGNITRTDYCACGATRQTEINCNSANTGPWEVSPPSLDSDERIRIG